MTGMGKVLILFGIVLIVLGLIFSAAGKIPWLGRLPGDIYVQKKNFTFYFPITTSILVSIFLTVIFMILRKR
jgi:heme/copper-type cytochrome/quinol oxidase subunit 2